MLDLSIVTLTNAKWTTVLMINKMVTDNAAFISYHLTSVFGNIQIIFVILLI